MAVELQEWSARQTANRFVKRVELRNRRELKEKTYKGSSIFRQISAVVPSVMYEVNWIDAGALQRTLYVHSELYRQ